MSNTKHPCGCVSNDTHWTGRCEKHQAESDADLSRMAISSLHWLMQHYDKWPNEDNLRHVIQRIKEVGTPAIAKDPRCAQWIAGRRSTLLEYSKRTRAAGSGALA